MAAFLHTVSPVRLGEFDLGGVLYHANYFHLYEEGREALFSKFGLPYSSLANRGEHLAIVESHQEFLSPVRYGQPLTLSIGFTEVKRTSFVAKYSIALCESSAAIHRAMTKHVFVRSAGGAFAPSRIPAELVSILEGHLLEPPHS